MTLPVEVKDLSFAFAESRPALDRVSFSVEEGECVGLVGPNGAGKSTLLLHLAGILPEGDGGPRQGEVRVFGRRVDRDNVGWIRRQVGLLFQDPDDQLFSTTVAEDVAFGPSQFGVASRDIEARVSRALGQVGLRGFEDRQPHRMSGGEKKRACLAGLLAYDPRLLVFDEPSAGLDPRGRRQLIELLRALPATKLIATHDLAMVAELCGRILVLDEGRIVADGPTEKLLHNDELMMAHGLECPRLELGLAR